MRNLNILVADDHNLVLQGFLFMLKSFSFTESVTGVGNGREVLNHLKNHRPDLILMDMEMPEMDGIETSERVLDMYPDVRIIVVSGFDDDDMIFQVIELGVHGYVLKDSKPEELKQAIESVMTRGFYYNDTVVRIMRTGIIRDSKRPKLHPRKELTEREKQLLMLLCKEKTTKEMADEMYLSDRTVEKIRKNLATKLEVKGTVGLVKFAIKNGYDL